MTSAENMSTIREETRDCCRERREEVDGQCGEEGKEEEEEEEAKDQERVSDANNKQEFMRVIGLQSPYHRVQTRLSCTQEEDGQCAEEDESMSSVYSGDECCDMLTVGGIMYHIEEINASIINTMSDEERRLYETLLAEYNAQQLQEYNA